MSCPYFGLRPFCAAGRRRGRGGRSGKHRSDRQKREQKCQRQRESLAETNGKARAPREAAARCTVPFVVSANFHRLASGVSDERVLWDTRRRAGSAGGRFLGTVCNCVVEILREPRALIPVRASRTKPLTPRSHIVHHSFIPPQFFNQSPGMRPHGAGVDANRV